MRFPNFESSLRFPLIDAFTIFIFFFKKKNEKKAKNKKINKKQKTNSKSIN